MDELDLVILNSTIFMHNLALHLLDLKVILKGILAIFLLWLLCALGLLQLLLLVNFYFLHVRNI